MTALARRAAFRAILAGEACIRPASVADPLSMRAAEAIGYEVAMLAGSVVSLSVLGAPDLAVLTLSELVEQVRRVCRAGEIPVLVDGDHGYGDALSVRRMVEEVDAAGAAAVTIEDTVLPAVGPGQLLPVATAAGKVRAGVDARRNDFVIVGRTNAALTYDPAELLERCRAYEDAGADAIFVAGIKTLAALDALAKGVSKPLMLATAIPDASLEEIAARGVRIYLQGHQPHFDAVAAHYRRLYVQRHGAEPDTLDPRALTRSLSKAETYAGWSKDYLS